MEVRLYANLRAIADCRSVELPLAVGEGATVRDLVAELVRRWPEMAEILLSEDGELSRSVNVFVDGRGTRWLPDGEDTLLRLDHALDVFPAVAGG